MFEITEETKQSAIVAIREVLMNHGEAVPDEAVLLEAVNAAIDTVKAQFGM
jgi:hypothetical protein